MPVCVMRVSGGEGNLTREGGSEQPARKNSETSHKGLDRWGRKKDPAIMDGEII